MKKYIDLINRSLLIIGLVLFILPSCNEDILEEKPIDFLSPDNAYLTEQGVVQGITALHDRVRTGFYSFTEFGTMSWRTHGSDLGYSGENPHRSQSYINSYLDVDPVKRYVVDTWNTGFQIIQWANVLIKKIETLEPDVFSDGEAGKNLHLGEARFFRAFIYRYLVSTYGDIPCLREPVEAAKADFVRDPVSEVHKLMEEDFKFASEHLPNPGDEASPGRITKGPALHYLGETYLEMGQPRKAGDVLQSIYGLGYGLMTERFGNHLDNDIFG
ncbi:MAG: RagB/SusD family nutrient uptake outer membrane protein, partial [Prolixibacteraceae bacterium]|nr:RagB/SusD family nutrient uptake outer membrane protein [Prolixibacteraceae bacterium]